MHGFETKFDAYDDGGPEAFATFVIKTMTFVSEQLQAAFPADTGLRHARQRRCDLRQLHDARRANVSRRRRRALGRAQRAPGGVRGLRRRRLLRAAAPDGPGPRSDRAEHRPLVDELPEPLQPRGRRSRCCQLAWLEWTLYRTKLRGRTASLLFHIPPGIDGYYSSHGSGTCRDNVTPFLKEAYEKPFLALLERYRDILQGSYAGHTHMDDFRVVATAAGEPILLTHITPAISPIYLNNPGFGLVLYDRASGDLIDYATVYLTNLADAGRGEAARWAIEYTFQDAYGYTAYDPRPPPSSRRRSGTTPPCATTTSPSTR